MTGGERDRTRMGPLEFDVEAARPVPAGEAEPTAPVPVPPPRSSSGRRWGLRLTGAGIAGLVLTAIGFDMAALIGRAWELSPWAGGIVATLVAAAAAGLGLLAGMEIAGLRRLARLEEIHAAAGGDALRFAGRVAGLYEGRPDLAPALEELRRQVTDAHGPDEVMGLVERILLHGLDRRAYQLVLRAARDTAVGTALSPAALLDVMLVMWRTLRLVREIATLYGVRPGWLGSLRLTRRVLGNLAIAGVAEGGSDLAVEAVGGTLAAFSARIGQGILNGMLTARVGLAAMGYCRPLPFREDSRPSLRRVRQELLGATRSVL